MLLSFGLISRASFLSFYDYSLMAYDAESVSFSTYDNLLNLFLELFLGAKNSLLILSISSISFSYFNS